MRKKYITVADAINFEFTEEMMKIILSHKSEKTTLYNHCVDFSKVIIAYLTNVGYDVSKINNQELIFELVVRLIDDWRKGVISNDPKNN